MRDKLILTDVDGVLLHWEFQFDQWMKKHGFLKTNEGEYETEAAYSITSLEADRLVRMFNETVYAGNMPPYADAVKYTRKLHEEFGIVFHAITSIGSDSEIVESRTKNLHRVFGKSMWYNITCLDPKVSKIVVLEQYAGSGCFWIEDHPHNYNLGKDLGLDSHLMRHHYNAKETNVKSIKCWKDIYVKYQ